MRPFRTGERHTLTQMPTTQEIPPNPAQTDEQQKDQAAVGRASSEESGSGPLKVRTGRFGELEEHEIMHLIDRLDDERSRSRFRESIYISLFFYIALAWFLIYGPQVIFHQPRFVKPQIPEQKELTFLDTPPDLAKLKHAPTNKIAETPHTAQTVKPTLDKKTLERLQAMRRSPAPTPAPPAPQQQAAPAPQPQQPPAPQQAQTPPPPTPLPQRAPQSPQTAMVDAPRPQPNFARSQSAGSAIQQAAQNALRGGGGGADYDHSSGSHGGLNTGVDVLSDTEGVDFGPYLTKILREIKSTWLPLIPEEARPPLNKQGETQIRFSILPNGKIGGMTLEGSTHDDALNRAAWGSITGVGVFPPLPAQFKGPNLELRIHYLVNKNPE